MNRPAFPALVRPSRSAMSNPKSGSNAGLGWNSDKSRGAIGLLIDIMHREFRFQCCLNLRPLRADDGDLCCHEQSLQLSR